MAEPAPAPRRPLHPLWLTDACVLAYAVWTIACNACVASRASMHVLVWMATGAFGCAGLALWGLRRRWLPDYLADVADEPAPPSHFGWRRAGWLVPAAIILVLAGWWVTRNPWVAWGGIAAYWLAVLVTAGRPLPPPEPPVRAVRRWEIPLLHALAIACAVFTLLAFRPRTDDTYYLHLAVQAADEPTEPLLGRNTLHGPASETLAAQPMFPPYRVHSFELLGGAISYLTGIEAARVVHFGLATLLGWLAPFAVARLLRVLEPRHWLAAVFVVVSYLCVEGSAPRGYANQAFVRLFNGKSALLTLAVPLIYAHGLRFGARPTRWRFALLGLSQIAAVGLSSTGLWLAPTAAVLSVAAATPRPRDLPKRLLASAASSAYTLAVALWVLGQIRTLRGAGAVAVEEFAPENGGSIFGLLQGALPFVLGGETTTLALLSVVALAVALASNLLVVRMLALPSALLALGFANPWLSNWVARNVTGLSTYERIFWLLPVPAALGLAFVGAQGRFAGRLSPVAAWTTSIGLLAAFYCVAADRLVISAANDAMLKFPPSLKLWPEARSVAEAACRSAPPGSYVVGPPAVMQQLPTLHHCGHPLLTESRWMKAPATETEHRSQLVRYLSGPDDVPPRLASWFIDSLARYRIQAAVMSREAVPNARTKSLLRLAGFELAETVAWNFVWRRVPSATRNEYRSLALGICRSGPTDAVVLAPFGIAREIDALKCLHPLLPNLVDGLDDDDEEVLRLERLVSTPQDLLAPQVAWFGGVLEQRNLRVVVMAESAMGNRRVRMNLVLHGFLKVAAQARHHVHVRFRAAQEAAR